MKNEFFECSCFSDEHTLKFTYDEEDNHLYTSVFLSERTFLKRVWFAVKYIFGYKCKYGHWDCFLLKEEDKERLINVVNQVK